MAFDYSKLKGKIKEKCNTQSAFALKMGFSNQTLSAKLGNLVDFNQEEIMKALKILELSDKDVTRYFFTPKV